jgi:hypothetical protein
MVGLLMNNELDRTWKEAAMDQLKVLFRNFPGGIEENHEKSQSQ